MLLKKKIKHRLTLNCSSFNKKPRSKLKQKKLFSRIANSEAHNVRRDAVFWVHQVLP